MFLFTILRTKRAMSDTTNTGEVISNIQPQSDSVSGATLNIAPAYVTIRICPTNITNTIHMNPALYDSLTFLEFVNSPKISCIRLQSVRKYFALNRFQNCNITNMEKNTPSS